MAPLPSPHVPSHQPPGTASSAGQWVGDRYEITAPLAPRTVHPEQPTSANPIRTFLGWDHQEKSPVVLKALPFEQLTGWKPLEHFEREAQVLSQLNHPSIPRYLDYIEHREPGASVSSFYLVQTWVGGVSLGERVRRGDRFSEAEALQIARQVLDILHYLHSLNPPLIHRDIKPDNLIDSAALSGTEPRSLSDENLSKTHHAGDRSSPENNSVPLIYLVDFGAAQDLANGHSTVMGTYGYMAPEQFRGQASPASDLYSLGTTLLKLLTHRDPVDLPTHRLCIDFRSILNLSVDFAQWLDALIAPVASDRFSSAQQALDALENPALIPPPRPVMAETAIASPTSSNTIAPQEQFNHHCVQPSDSAIRLQRHSGSYPLGKPSLTLDIPPIGLRRELLALGSFALLWNGGLLYWLIMAWAMDAPWFYPLASAPLWGIGILLLGRLGSSFFGQVRLLVQGDEYCLEQRLGPICQTQRGALKDWQSVGLRQQYSRGSEAVAAIALVLGLKTVEFGAMLSEAEKAWLVEELQDFLTESR